MTAYSQEVQDLKRELRQIVKTATTREAQKASPSGRNWRGSGFRRQAV